MAQDESGRELLMLLSRLSFDMGTALVGYLGLFRSASRDLANDRALKLAKDVLQLGTEPALIQAMRNTVEQIQAKGGKPLTNHNYLKRVLEDVGCALRTDVANGTQCAPYAKPARFSPHADKPRQMSNTEMALQALEDFGNGD
jgi:hypothetical protein